MRSSRLLHPVTRFRGEFFLLGLALAAGTFLLFGAMAAWMVTAVAGLIQVLLLRRTRLLLTRTAGRLTEAQADAVAWEKRAFMLMDEVGRCKHPMTHVDPDTAVGTIRQFEVDFGKLVARFSRHHERFALTLLELHGDGPEHGVDPRLALRCAHAILETSRAEDSVCRLSEHQFAVLLPMADRAGAEQFLKRVRGRMSGLGGMIAIYVGAAEWTPDLAGVWQLLERAQLFLDRDRQTAGRFAADARTAA